MPFSSEWKWSGWTLRNGGGATYVLGAPDVLAEAGALDLPPALRAKLEEHTSAGRRVVAFGEAEGRLPGDPAPSRRRGFAPLALVVLEERLRPDAAETIEFMREQKVDLKLISGDARQTVTAVAHAVGVPRDAGVVEGPDLPDRPRRPRRGRRAQHDLLPHPPRAEEGPGGGAQRARTDHRDDRRRGQRRPGAQAGAVAVAMGSGSQITKGVADVVLLKDQYSMLPRAVHEGRRIARNIHRLARLYLTKTRLRGLPDPHRGACSASPSPSCPAISPSPPS